ncbi:MAG: sulfatase-like hydrolase/transferase [Propionibacteriales bacterium]|nr:sulfatase-like hydrolase/transferase [Propionibacteriales bacterium]
MPHRLRGVTVVTLLALVLAVACGGASRLAEGDDDAPGDDPAESAGGAPESQWPSPGYQKKLRQDTVDGAELRRLQKGRSLPRVRKPNIVLILTDDQTLSDMRWMPKTRSLFEKAGVRFREAISPNPLCCPARAEILTGQYSHNNGVRTNHWPNGGYYALDKMNTVPVWLQEAGYRTAFLGKYLNQYGDLDAREVPPGWDVWHGAVGLSTYDFHNVRLNVNGHVREYSGVYQTDLYAAQTERLIERFSQGDRPFFLWQSHVAPHKGCNARYSEDPTGGRCWTPPDPSPAYAGMFDDTEPPQWSDRSYDEKDTRDKPRWLHNRVPLADQVWDELALTELFQRRIESLQSVEDSVARTMAALKKAGELDETLIIFASDNGYLLGEHKLSGKNIGYEPALRVPMFMRGPGVPAGRTIKDVVSIVDIGATIAHVAGADPTVRLDGRNLTAISRGQRPGWNTMLIEGGSSGTDAKGRWRYIGVRTSRYTYIQWRQTGEVELYDRRRDPDQLTNVAGTRAYSKVETEMRHRLSELERCEGAECRRGFRPAPRPRMVDR